MARLVPLVLALGLALQPPATSTRAVVDSAATYVAEYQKQLTYVLAEETYTQQVLAMAPGDIAMMRPRLLRSETFFLFTAPEHGWMAIRDVIEVDGEPVRDRRSPLEALQTLPPGQVAAEFKELNSRFNIGHTYRNFNEPTLSLLPLTGLHRGRFSFDRRRVERDGDVTLVTLAFREREPPTLIRDLRHGRLYSRGELVVEAATGRVRRAELTAEARDLRVRLVTDYDWEPRLRMLVPVRFREEYERGSDRAARRGEEHERIHCEATYSNYRRFETSASYRQAGFISLPPTRQKAASLHGPVRLPCGACDDDGSSTSRDSRLRLSQPVNRWMLHEVHVVGRIDRRR